MEYEEFGTRNAPTVLLLHGAGVKDTFCRQMGMLTARYHVVLPHLPGGGRAAAEVYEPERTVKQLLTLVDALPEGPLAVVGHSLGAQLAVRLVCARPQRFACAVFLSAWVHPSPAAIRLYCAAAGLCAGMMHWKWLVRLQGAWWHFPKEQSDAMADAAARLTAEGYRAFFAHTLDLSALPAYSAVTVPMLAVCGSGEVRDMKTSLTLLARNPCCRTVLLKGGHDYPMRRPEALDALLLDFLGKHL